MAVNCFFRTGTDPRKERGSLAVLIQRRWSADFSRAGQGHGLRAGAETVIHDQRSHLQSHNAGNKCHADGACGVRCQCGAAVVGFGKVGIAGHDAGNRQRRRSGIGQRDVRHLAGRMDGHTAEVPGTGKQQHRRAARARKGHRLRAAHPVIVDVQRGSFHSQQAGGEGDKDAAR